MRPPLTDEPLVGRRTLLIGGGVVLAGVAAWIVGDLLIVTDEELLEDFSEAVTGTIDRDRITAALPYFDPARTPLTVEVQGTSHRFGAEDAARFESDARSRLAPYDGLHVGLLGRTIDVQGQTAHVVLHTFSRRGRNTIEIDLRKREGKWFVTWMRIV